MSIYAQLKRDLTPAMRSRDRVRVDTIRTLISAIDNAGAVDGLETGHEPKLGLSHDVDRKDVTMDQERQIVTTERDDLLAAADEFRDLGKSDRANELAMRAQIASTYLA